MKVRKTFRDAPRMIFKPEFDACPPCQEPLSFSHTVWRKHVIRLDGVIYAVAHGHVCPRCNGPVYRSARAEALALKYGTFGVDVIVKTGLLRFRDHLNRREIWEKLRQLRIPISERHVQNLYESYLLLVRCDLDTAIERAKPELERNGGLVLSLDGVQPDKGNETLYVVREVLTGIVLAAENLTSGSADNIKAMLQPIVDLGFPVLGVVSDAQESIRKAIREILPRTPHQYCHYHYLKDAALPFVDQNRKLKTQIKKSLQPIRDVEHRVADEQDPRGAVILGFSNALRTLILERGNPPLDPAGLRVFERLELVKASLERCLQHTSDRRLESLLRLARKSEHHRSWYETLKEEQGWLVEIARILDPENHSKVPSSEARQKAEAKLCVHVKELKERHGGVDQRHDALLDSIEKYTRGFFPGLFTCFDQPALPRTNNDLERFIRVNKTRYRRITGRQRWSDFILRVGEFVVFVNPEEPEQAQVERLSRVSYDQYRARRDRWEARREPARLRFRFRRDPAQFLATLEQAWTDAAEGVRSQARSGAKGEPIAHVCPGDAPQLVHCEQTDKGDVGLAPHDCQQLSQAGCLKLPTTQQHPVAPKEGSPVRGKTIVAKIATATASLLMAWAVASGCPSPPVGPTLSWEERPSFTGSHAWTHPACEAAMPTHATALQGPRALLCSFEVHATNASGIPVDGPVTRADTHLARGPPAAQLCSYVDSNRTLPGLSLYSPVRRIPITPIYYWPTGRIDGHVKISIAGVVIQRVADVEHAKAWWETRRYLPKVRPT